MTHKVILKKIVPSFLIFSSLLFIGFIGEKEKIKKTTFNHTDAYYLKLDRFELPFGNNGSLADVTVNPNLSTAKFDGKTVIFSGGFFLGGKLYPGTYYESIWVNGVMSSFRVQDYLPGKVGMSKDDPNLKIYVVQSSDPPFSQSWIDWKNAVELGADFYDGDGDGVYNPVDKNKNGKWDLNEDKPGLIGDFTAYYVYNDGVIVTDRWFAGILPLGIEIHQTIWAYKNIPKLANSVFIRYRIFYRGSSYYPDVNRLDSVIFSFVNDFDIGDYTNDLFGTDTLLQANYCYNQGPDMDFGNNPPVIMAQLLQGPAVFIPGVSFNDLNGNGIFDSGDTPITTAKEFIIDNYIKEIPGAINLNLSSSNANFGLSWFELTLYTVWNLLRGLAPNGIKYNPCTFELGVVVGGVDCNQVNPLFLFSGDPVENRGWINNSVYDIRAFLNVGQFSLEKNKPVDIIVAYAVGRGTNALNSITEARKVASINKSYFDLNLIPTKYLPETELKARSFENKLDIYWTTSNDFQFKDLITTLTNDTLANIEFEAYELWAHSTPELYYGPDTTRSKRIAGFDVKNDIENLYYLEEDRVSIKNIFSNYSQLDPQIYSNSENGYIFVSIETNPFTGKKLKKGERLYFSLRKLFLNKTSTELVKIQNVPKSYLIPFSHFGLREKVSDLYEFRVGEDFNTPINLSAKPVAALNNTTESEITFEEVDNSQLTDDDYQLSFFRDVSTTEYSMFWRLKNLSKNRIVLDSQKIYYNIDQRPIVVEGLYPKIKWILPEIKKVIYQPDSNKWFQDFKFKVSGIFYAGSERVYGFSAREISPLTTLGLKKSNLTTFDKLRKIEIRFGQTQKAYRFISNTLGNIYQSAASTIGESGIGKPGEYFVEVPFQVWINDNRFGEERQLTCAFIEARPSFGGNPDGQWDPKTDISKTREYIIVFNQPYDPNGNQMEYVGYLPSTGTKVYARLDGWNPPAEANFTQEQIERARSPWFDALLVIGLERTSPDTFYRPGDILTIPISYVITERDTFYYRSKSKMNKLTIDEKKALIDKINVFPNPYIGWEDYRSVRSGVITFTNLPEEVTIKIYTLSGNLVRILTENDKSTITSPFIEWDLRNKDGMRVADGVYLAHIKTKYGDKVLKFALVKQKR